MNIHNILMTVIVLTSACGVTGCIMVKPPVTDCNPDPTSHPISMRCFTYTEDTDGSEFVTRDLTTSIALSEEDILKSQARHFASKFSLSDEQGMKIARSIHDFEAIQTRSDADVADFATRLYGISPSRILSAAGKAQGGDVTELNALAAEAAKNFETTPENMKRIVKSLHGQLLQEQGIRF